MRTGLIVVDFQRDFVDGALGFPGALAIEDAVVQAIRRCRAEGGEVLFTMDTHEGEGHDGFPGHCVAGTGGWDLYGAVARERRPEDRVFCKAGFGSLRLGAYLEEAGFERIVVAGLVSHLCVLANCVMAVSACPQARVEVDPACVAGPDPALSDAAYRLLGALGVRVGGKSG